LSKYEKIVLVWVIYLAGVALSCAMAWALGANDAANPTDCAVGAGVISLRRALALFAVFSALGGILIGSLVMKTFDRGIVDRKTGIETGALSKESLVLGSLVAALSAVIWVTASTWLGMPVSTTHSAVGAMLGFGLATCPGLIVWDRVKLILIGIIISPTLSLILAMGIFHLVRCIFYKASRRGAMVVASFMLFSVLFITSISVVDIFFDDIRKIVVISAAESAPISLTFFLFTLRWRDEWIEKTLSFLLIFALAFSAFAFGANDLANATGVFVTPTEIMIGKPTRITMFLLSLLGSLFVAIGGLTWGKKVLATTAYKVTKLDPVTGLSAELANAFCVFLFTTVPAWLIGFGLPISTTHSSVGSIIGVGLASGGIGHIHGGTTRKILLFWALTIPCTALISAGIFRLISGVIL
jgi:PiT family inorganic phosphate transporter